MEQSKSPTQEPTQEQKTQVIRSGVSLKNILTGVFIGILIGIAGLLFYQGHLPQITQALYTATWVLFGCVILTFLIFFGLREYLTRFIFGTKTAGAKDVLEDAQRVSDVITERVADKLLADLPFEERSRIKNILPRLANWFIWGRLRNWWWQWILGIFVSLGGITGTMLLMNQNELLNNQNTLIQHQMSLEEASRRSALVMLMSNIMDKVDDEIKDQKSELLKKGVLKTAVDTINFSLSQSLIGQISALSHSFKPYRYLDEDTLISKYLSPERGQLLITLVQLPLDSNTFSKIFASSTFDYADLQKAILQNANLSGAHLRGARLIEADLQNADLQKAYLQKADLGNSDLGFANLYGAHLYGAKLNDAKLIEADMSKADLQMASLNKAILDGANLTEATLSWADLTGVRLCEADLSRSVLYMTILQKSNLCNTALSITQISNVRSLYECEGIQDSIKTILLKTHPDLFEKPKSEQ